MKAWWAGLLLAVAATGVQAALPIVHWTQPSGARVYWVQSSALPMLDVQIDVDGGSRRDPPGQAGLADATALMVGKGAKAVHGQPARDENQLVEAWADLGAEFQVSATQDRLSVQLRTLTRPEILNPAMRLAAQQLAAPSFPAAVWQRESDRLVAAWREAQTRPDTLAGRRFRQSVYGSHPYGREADPESWAALDVAAMGRFYRQHARACDARVTVVGDAQREEVDRWVRDLLAGWSSHGCAPLPDVAEVPPLAHPQTVRAPFDAAQAQILVGQPAIARSSPDFLPFLVGNHILGGSGFASRLMQEIREKRGLTYGVYSDFQPGRHAGAFVVSMQTRPDQAQQAVDLIHSELRRFVADGPSDAELEQARGSLINGFALRLDSNRKILGNVASIAWNDLPLDYLDTWPQRVRSITREQIRETFQRVLQPECMVTVVVGGAP